MTRFLLYVLANLCFAILVIIAGLVRTGPGPHGAYLIALAALCTAPLIEMRRLNDRYALLAYFSAMYFMLFGILDLSALLTGAGGDQYRNQAQELSATEWVILAGGLAVQLGYRIGVRLWRPDARRLRHDWPRSLTVYGAMTLCAFSTWLSWRFNIDIMVAPTAEAQRLGYGSLTAWQVFGFMVSAYVQPLSIVVLAYAYCQRRQPVLAVALAAIVLVQLALGFIGDYKSEALKGAVLIVLTRLLVEGRVPKVWVIASAVFIAIVFPVLQANRAVRYEYNLNHAQAAQEIGKTISRALEMRQVTTSGPDRAQTFFERMSLKGSVDLIVTHTGHDVAFRNGYTLLPLLAVFIPRIAWPDKPSIEVGRLVTKDFSIGESSNLYTSPSHLGELYWNFGWPGVILGMAAIGLLLGIVGAASDLSAAVTLTRVLVVMVTLQQLMISFESTFAAPYAVWIRSMVALGIAHAIMVRMARATEQLPLLASDAPGPQRKANYNHLME